MLGVMVDSCVDRTNTDDLSCIKSVRIYLRKCNVIFKHAKICTSNWIIMWQYCQFDNNNSGHDVSCDGSLVWKTKQEDCLHRSQVAFCFTLMIVVEAEWNLFLIVVRMMPRWHEPITACEILLFLTSSLLHLTDRFVSADWSSGFLCCLQLNWTEWAWGVWLKPFINIFNHAASVWRLSEMTLKWGEMY